MIKHVRRKQSKRKQTEQTAQKEKTYFSDTYIYVFLILAMLAYGILLTNGLQHD